MLEFEKLRPLQAMAANLFFKHKKLLLSLPRQYGGKTELGVRLLHDITNRPFTSSSLFLAKSKNAAKKATREKFMRIFDEKKFSINTEQVYLREHPTSIIFIDSVDKEPDKIRGGTNSLVHWSEVAFSKVEHGVTITDVFDKILQPTGRLLDAYYLLESTNNGKNGWHDLWHNAAQFGFAKLCVPFWMMTEMGLISEAEYLEVKRTTQPDVFLQEFECEWVSFQGKVYPELTESHIRPCEPPEWWQLNCIAIDWGYHPSATCVLFAYVKDGVMYVYQEHYRTEEKAIDTAAAINHYREIYKMRSIAAVGDHEQDRIDELNDRGIECSKADKVDTFGARLTIKEMLFKNELVIDPKCKNLLKDLDACIWHVRKENDIDYDACTWGHFDGEATLRYLVRSFRHAERDKPLTNPFVGTSNLSAIEWNKRTTIQLSNGGEDKDYGDL